jgi:hypothetical protein
MNYQEFKNENFTRMQNDLFALLDEKRQSEAGIREQFMEAVSAGKKEE